MASWTNASFSSSTAITALELDVVGLCRRRRRSCSLESGGGREGEKLAWRRLALASACVCAPSPLALARSFILRHPNATRGKLLARPAFVAGKHCRGLLSRCARSWGAPPPSVSNFFVRSPAFVRSLAGVQSRCNSVAIAACDSRSATRKLDATTNSATTTKQKHSIERPAPAGTLRSSLFRSPPRPVASPNYQPASRQPAHSRPFRHPKNAPTGWLRSTRHSFTSSHSYPIPIEAPRLSK